MCGHVRLERLLAMQSISCQAYLKFASGMKFRERLDECNAISLFLAHPTAPHPPVPLLWGLFLCLPGLRLKSINRTNILKDACVVSYIFICLLCPLDL